MELTINGRTGTVLELLRALSDEQHQQPPFSFNYAGRPSGRMNGAALECGPWREDAQGLARQELAWTFPEDELRAVCSVTFYEPFSAVEWSLRFENTGSRDTAIISDVQVADIRFAPPEDAPGRFRVHSMRGGTRNASMFEPKTTALVEDAPFVLGSASGRSSTLDSPFYKLETDARSFVCAVEWSGTWCARFDREGTAVRMRTGMELTHFRLRPGESVRTPGVLILDHEGRTERANAAFRRLLARHVIKPRGGQAPEPVVFCNTCFTRGGGWLGETTAENQISLIEAYAKLGAEAVITDAGWFDGWDDGLIGQWTPREDNYPGGMAPVAKAAQENGIVYGLWFEPEKVCEGTAFFREHPDWILKHPDKDGTHLANFALPEVQEHFFAIVDRYMQLPGFNVYRQDFNFDPLVYWRHADAADRQGITEMKYIEGMYAYWESIATAHPDALLEECAGGGHRIDLGTIRRMHIHQKTDHWFDYESDQTSLWSVSQYMPNQVIVAHLRDLDDYSFHSTLPSSLCLGWIADDAGFDSERAASLIARYKRVRHLLTGDWYPLLPFPYEYHDLNAELLRFWLLAPSEPDPDDPDAEKVLELHLRRPGAVDRTLTVRLGDTDNPPQHVLRVGGSEPQVLGKGQNMLYLNTWAMAENHTRPYTGWVGSQYHRPGLGEGMVLVMRRPDSPFPEVQVKLRELDERVQYELEFDTSGETQRVPGKELLEGFALRLEKPRSSQLVIYRPVG